MCEYLYYVYVGSVYVYGSVGNVWSRQSKILAKDGANSDYFGRAIDVYGTRAMIGAYQDSDKAAYAGIINLTVAIFIF